MMTSYENVTFDVKSTDGRVQIVLIENNDKVLVDIHVTPEQAKRLATNILAATIECVVH